MFDPPDFSAVSTAKLLYELIRYVVLDETTHEQDYYFEITHRAEELEKRINKKENSDA